MRDLSQAPSWTDNEVRVDDGTGSAGAEGEPMAAWLE